MSAVSSSGAPGSKARRLRVGAPIGHTSPHAGPYWLQPAVPHCVQHLDQAALKSDLKVGFGPYTGALLRTFAFSQIDVLPR